MKEDPAVMWPITHYRFSETSQLLKQSLIAFRLRPRLRLLELTKLYSLHKSRVLLIITVLLHLVYHRKMLTFQYNSGAYIGELQLWVLLWWVVGGVAGGVGHRPEHARVGPGGRPLQVHPGGHLCPQLLEELHCDSEITEISHESTFCPWKNICWIWLYCVPYLSLGSLGCPPLEATTSHLLVLMLVFHASQN